MGAGLRAGLCGAVLLATACPASAIAETSPPARPGLTTSAPVNFAFALGQVCLPYVLHGDETALKSGWGVSPIGWGPQFIFKNLGLSAHLIGIAGRINVGEGVVDGERQCVIEANQGDPTAYRAELTRIVSSEPGGFAPAKSPYPRGAYAARDLYCATDPSSGVAVLASFSAPSDRRGPAALVTVVEMHERAPRCDHEGVPPPAPRPGS